MLSNRHESFPLLSIRYAGSRFARDLENIASRVYTGWVENVVESTRIASPAVDSLCRKSICASLRKYRSIQGLRSIQGRLKMLSIRFDSNESTRIVSLAVDSLYRKSICEILRNIASRVYTGLV